MRRFCSVKIHLQVGSTRRFRGVSTFQFPFSDPTHFLKAKKILEISFMNNGYLILNSMHKWIPWEVLLASNLVLRHLKFSTSSFLLREIVFSQNLFHVGTTLWAKFIRDFNPLGGEKWCHGSVLLIYHYKFLNNFFLFYHNDNFGWIYNLLRALWTWSSVTMKSAL